MSDHKKPHGLSAQEDHFHGRRKGRPLQKARAQALVESLPHYQVDLSTLNADRPLWVEIGFGNGEHLCALAQREVDIQLIGCEPYENGVSACLVNYESIEGDKAPIQIWPDPAQALLDTLPDQSVERIYLLNPDPWPKKRHHKRRFVSKINLDRFARILKPGGQFIASTDVDALAEWMLEHTINHPAFEWMAESKQDWETPPADWAITTRYHAKGAAKGHIQRYLLFKRR